MMRIERSDRHEERLFMVEGSPASGGSAHVGVLGRVQSPGGFRIRSRADCFALHLVERGRIQLDLGGERHDLGPGDAFLLRPGVGAEYGDAGPQPWSYTWIGMSGASANGWFARVGFTVACPVRRECIGDQIRHLCSDIESTYAAGGHSPFYPIAAAFRLFDQLAPRLMATPRHDAVAALERLLAAGYQRPNLTIAELAEDLGVDRSTLFRRLRAQHGIGPRALLMRVRLDHAERLLRRGDLSLEQVRERTGFADRRTFSRRFRERFGVPPGQYCDAPSPTRTAP